MIIEDYAYKFWRYLAVAGALAIFFGASVFIVTTLPPRELVMATGAEGDANYELGIQYREILAKEGVKLRLLPTAGSMENLRHLRDPQSGVSVGFIQGGTATRKEAPELESLGTVFYEPLWLFRRDEIGDSVQALRGRRLSIGSEGSGGRALALRIIEKTKIDSIIGELLGFSPQVAAVVQQLYSYIFNMLWLRACDYEQLLRLVFIWIVIHKSKSSEFADYDVIDKSKLCKSAT